ncbi:MAG: PLP-dependent aspartate aminotransferase family protein [Candidatus Omnitrophica bacterium]|nr:PLP-dependent aspartate aminotransferase family protein [Candidatus Omnitrophota bacterium]
MRDSLMAKQWGLATVAVHGPGRKSKAHHAVSTPIVQTSNYSFESTAEVVEFMKAKGEGRLIRESEYGRYGNPTQAEAERKLAAIEGAEQAILFSSGMSAVIMALLTFQKRDGHIIFTSDCYRQTRDFAIQFMGKLGLQTTLVEPSAAAIQKAIRPNTNIIFTESPTNPYLRVIDLAEIVKVARAHGVLTMIDATLATPYNLRPLEMGIDLVIHSATKYLGGHNDLLAGVVLGRRDLLEEVGRLQRMFGAIPGALTSFLLERGLKTFALRMEHHNRAGLEVAQALEAHPKVEKVWYPGLESHPDHAIAKGQMRGFGSVISLLIRGGDTETRRFIDQLKLFLITPSLGGTESLVTQMATMSFFESTPEYRQSIGMVDNLVRLALGLEDIRDVIADLCQALDRI